MNRERNNSQLRVLCLTVVLSVNCSCSALAATLSFLGGL
jgi:hypothetical protein